MLLSSYMSDHSGGLTILVGLIALIVAVWIFFVQRKRKTLDFEVKSLQRLLTVEDGTPTGLEVSFNGHELRRPALITVRMMNTGNQEIRPEDLFEPPSFTVANVEIVNVAVERSKDTLHQPPTISFDGPTFTAAPVLYNRFDWVDFQLLVDSDTLPKAQEITVRSVIAGQTRASKRVEELKGSYPQRAKAQALFVWHNPRVIPGMIVGGAVLAVLINNFVFWVLNL